MRIILDLPNHIDRLSDAGSLFIRRSMEELDRSFPTEEWITVPELETKGLQSLVPRGIKKSKMLGKLNPDLIISTYPGDRAIQKYRNRLLLTNRDLIRPGSRPLLSGNSKIITTSDFIRDELISKSIANKEIICQVYPAPSIIKSAPPLDSSETLKYQFTDGCEFLLAPEPIEPGEWEVLIRAFSIFKKWQQSELMLVLQNDSGISSVFSEKLLSYRYRESIRIVDRETSYKLLPVAYAYISIKEEVVGMDILNAFSCNIPVITRAENIFAPDLKEAILETPLQSEQLAKQIIMIYKDERKRDSMISLGESISRKYTWDQTIRQWWECIK